MLSRTMANSPRRSSLPSFTLPSLAAFFVLSAPLLSAQSLGLFEHAQDVGVVLHPGQTKYDAAANTYTLTGSGENMWFGKDQFQFVWKKATGDLSLAADIHFLGDKGNNHRKAVLIIRQSLDTGSPAVDIALHGDGLTSLQFRRTPGAVTEQVQSALKAPDVIQLERKGRTYTMSVAKFGDAFTRTEVADIDLGDEVYVGLFLCSHNPKVSETATFRNVRIVVPPKEGWAPYRDYIGSNLETLAIETGDLTVLDTSPISVQAPNWTPDGKHLIYNSEGKLYRFDLAARTATVIDTGLATRNNNDHVLSWGGTMLSISHHTAEDNNRSVVYTLPVGGGTQKRITAKSP